MLDRIFLSVNGGLPMNGEESELPLGRILGFDMELVLSIIAQGVVVIGLVFVLAYILYNPVKNFMAERAAGIKDDIDSARLDREKAEQTKADYQNLLEGIDQEREEILNRAHNKANEVHDNILAEAHKVAEELKAKAHNDIDIERANTADEIKRQIIEVSVLVASRFVKDFSVDQETQDRYIDEALADWSEGRYELD